MPALELTYSRLERLLKREVDVEKLEYDLLWLGLDLKDVREDSVKVEYEPNRPDFSSPEGIARALRGYYGVELGTPKWKLGKSDVVVNVESSVAGVRPFLVSGLVRNVDLEDDEIATLMNIQEALHHVLGRGRRKVAIGVHDFDKVKPPFTYKGVKPDGIKFRPLQMEAFEMTPQEILEEHPKGIEYAHILDGKDLYPVIVDANGDVVSFPPVINGYLTTVTEETQTLFLDLTGTDYRAVSFALNILITCLADMGTDIETVDVKYQEPVAPVTTSVVTTPDLENRHWAVPVEYINDYIGLDLSSEEMIECLRKVRMDARLHPKLEGHLEVDVPAYRVDILHPVDFAEEVAIGYNYKNLPLTIREGGVGSYHPVWIYSNRVRTVIAWAGYLEMFNFILTSGQREFEYMGVKKKKEDIVQILNPVSSEYDTTRVSLLPSLMRNLQFNKHAEKPLRLFEVGDVLLLDSGQPTGGRREVHCAAVTQHGEAGFTEIRSVLDFLSKNLGLFDTVEVVPAKHSTFIEGRVGAIKLGKTVLGHIGEVAPEVLERFELDHPVSAFEVNLEPLIERDA
ncbi:MAG: phenylalanine--tRNA ligase subunit beta [Promethearchaeota archaeon]